ncbi:MAG: formate dehydrogenase accessory sulfurtransferase FdhD [Bacillota bacterium]|nr:formate dehydrogenase accessory sulfurtransferase FdhD [Bacillota bacterium]
MLVKNIELKRYVNGHVDTITDCLIREISPELLLNDVKVGTMVCTELHMEELAVGMLFGKGLINRDDEILSIEADRTCVHVHAKASKPADIAQSLPGSSSEFMLDYDRILSKYMTFSESFELFNKTGGAHCAELLDSDMNTIFKTEDMGRHNAIDKIIGYAILNDIYLGDKLLMVSSRIPIELVRKCYRGGIVNMAAISAATAEGAAFAKEHNMNVMGMFRGKRFNIYSQREV